MKTILLAAAVAFASLLALVSLVGSATAGQNCRTNCNWVGNQQYCNTYCN